jgi:hypothetical protein
VASRSSVALVRHRSGAYVPEQGWSNAIRPIARRPGFRSAIEIRIDRL